MKAKERPRWNTYHARQRRPHLTYCSRSSPLWLLPLPLHCAKIITITNWQYSTGLSSVYTDSTERSTRTEHTSKHLINLIIRLLLAFYITRQFSPTLFSVDYVRLKKLSRYKKIISKFSKRLTWASFAFARATGSSSCCCVGFSTVAVCVFGSWFSSPKLLSFSDSAEWNCSVMNEVSLKS